MKILQVINLVVVSIAFVLLLVAWGYIVKTRKYNRSTDAYLKGDIESGKALRAKADQFLRFLP